MLLLICIPLVASEIPWVYKGNESYIIQNSTFILPLERHQQNSRVSDVYFNTTIFPKNTYRQRIITRLLSVNKNITEDFFQYHWKLPNKDIKLEVNTYVLTQDNRQEIKNKVLFPVRQDDYVKKYSQPTENIDSDNPEIKKLAAELAEGEDDLFELVTKIGIFVHENIEYELNHETGPETMPASWVLENKIGVCDEFSTLFMAICRALDIPVRYVGGMAYSNAAEKEWESHGWAEVYFPGKAWVPFDPTFGEFGFVDLSHISFYKTKDSSSTTTTLNYEARDAEMSLMPPILSANLTLFNGTPMRRYNFSLTPYKDVTGFNSHNYLDFEINNTLPYYQTLRVILWNTEGIEYLDETDHYVVLRPNENKHIYYRFKTVGDFSEKYYYSFPLVVSDPSNYTARTEIQVKKDFQVIPEDIITDYVKALKKAEKSSDKSIVKDIELSCYSNLTETYVDYPLNLSCTVKNRGNTKLERVKICLLKGCDTFSLDISEDHESNFAISFEEQGLQSLIFELNAEDVSKNYFIDINVHPFPNITIKDLNTTSKVRYQDDFILNFEVNNDKNSPVNNVEVNVHHDFFNNSWKLKNFKSNWEIKLNGEARDLKAGENNFLINVTYLDVFGKEYSISSDETIILEKVNIIQRIPLSIRNFFRWLDNLFD